MSTSTAISPQIFTKDTLHNGKDAAARCTVIAGQTYEIRRGLLAVLALEDEWYEDVADPHTVARIGGRFADLFTFWQRVPDVVPRYPFHVEWEDLAVLPITTYDDWWKRGIKPRVRNHVRQAEKSGVVIRRVPFDDTFVEGMTAIFNEAPIRQGRPFWHYGKDFATVKRQFSRFVFREHMIGAYHDDKLIGFVMLADAGAFGVPAQILSSIAHRDKFTNYALMAKAVEVCEAERLNHLVYYFFGDDSLSEFKRRCGFECVRVPRYFVPLTWKGRLALRCGLHRGVKARVPASIKQPLKRARSRWLELTSRGAA